MINTNKINAGLIASIFTVLMIGVTGPAQAAWLDEGMHPVGLPTSNQVQSIHHQVQMSAAPAIHVHQNPTVTKPQELRHDQTTHHVQAVRRDQPLNNAHIEQHGTSYRHHDNDFSYLAVPVPQSALYQPDDQQGDISPDIGAIYDSIPTDYQVVMVDGVNYLLADGIYYIRVPQGFEVVQAPVM